MGLFNSLRGRLGVVGAEAQQIAKNGVPTVSTNPAEIVQSAVTVKHDVAIAGAMKNDVAGGVTQVQNQDNTTGSDAGSTQSQP